MNEVVEVINKHIDLKEGVHIKRAIQPFGWEIVLEHLQRCADQEYAGIPNGKMSFQLNQAEEIEDVKKCIEFLNEDLSLKIFDAHIFTSFTSKRDIQPHKDNHNVLLWALTENMRVQLFDDEEETPWYDKELEPGDMFYIPANLDHKVEVTGSRALVSFGIEVSPGENYLDGVVDNPYIPPILAN